jgi:hypothetical protein
MHIVDSTQPMTSESGDHGNNDLVNNMLNLIYFNFSVLNLSCITFPYWFYPTS